MSLNCSLFKVFFACTLLFGVVLSAKKGKVTHYDANGEGACSFVKDTSNPLMITAFSGPEWRNAAYCGRCVRITGSSNKSIVVRIIDECPECAKGHFDLSKSAFSILGNLDLGVIEITYEFVPCPTEGNLFYRVKKDSSIWWTSVVINNHKYGVKKFELKGNGMNWAEAKRTEYNEFEYQVPSGTELKAPISFRVTSMYDEVITDENIITDTNNLRGIHTSCGQFSVFRSDIDEDSASNGFLSSFVFIMFAIILIHFC